MSVAAASLAAALVLQVHGVPGLGEGGRPSGTATLWLGPAPLEGGLYGMAWGINNGILDRATYLPVVKAGWQGLVSHVDANGRLGYVQGVGAAPAPASATSNAPYGVGAFLLAGSEVAKL